MKRDPDLDHLIDLDYYEINAQVNQLAQLKQDVGEKTWDSFTFEDMVSKSVSSKTLYILFKSRGVLDTWKKNILSRLSREGLLGKSMSKRGQESKLFEQAEEDGIFLRSTYPRIWNDRV